VAIYLLGLSEILESTSAPRSRQDREERRAHPHLRPGRSVCRSGGQDRLIPSRADQRRSLRAPTVLAWCLGSWSSPRPTSSSCGTVLAAARSSFNCVPERAIWTGTGLPLRPAISSEMSRSSTRPSVKQTRELGITDLALRPLCAMHRSQGEDPIDQRVDYFLLATDWSGEPTIREPDKCADLRWFPLDALPDPVVPHELQVIEDYRRGIIEPSSSTLATTIASATTTSMRQQV